MSQRSVSNTSESKLPNLHSLNNCQCVAAVAAFLRTRLPFENKLLRFLSCLNPDRRSDASLRAIEFVASKLRTPAADIANVPDEWRLYIYDEEIRKLEKGTRVDHYWHDIFNSRQQMETRDTLC